MKMAAGLAKMKAEQYQGKITAHLIITCIIAAIGGFIFGYIGISGAFSFSFFIQVFSTLNLNNFWFQE